MTQILKKVGPYRLTRRIGSGATSQVFEAIKQGDHQKYAIKMIRLNKITQNQKQMILKQISLIKSISHTNIVKLYDHLQTTNNFYLVFEYCEKGDLEKYLRQYYGPLIPEDAVQKIFFCIGDAVNQIHSKGIVHRDIKLANILLKRDLVIKLADFGFAKQINQEEFMLKTYCGTPITMAPQILQSKYYDRKCDIWSLGVIMFQLVYGKLPFSIAQGYNKFVERVIKQPLKIPSQPQMPQQFKQLLSKCLEKNPQKRYSIQDFMHSEWILKGKDKKLQQRKKQVQVDVSQLLRDVTHQSIEKQFQEQEKQRHYIIQFNTAEKLYKILKGQIEKIIQNHQDNRQQIWEKLEKVKNGQETHYLLKKQYENLEKLLYYLDFKYLQFLQNLKINVVFQNSQIYIKLTQINGLQFPQMLFKEKTQLKNQPQKLSFAEIMQSFLKNPSLLQTDTLQKRKQRYQIIDRFFQMLRRYDLSVDIMFAHHYHRRQISLENVFKQFKQLGKEISQSMIQEPSKRIQEENEQKRISQVEDKQNKYDKLSNFVTISMQCKQKSQKMKEFRQNLKQTGERMIDQITKTIQGYYN